MIDFERLKNLINPQKSPDKQFFLDLLDGEKQLTYEAQHIDAVMKMLRIVRLGKLKEKLSAAKTERETIMNSEDYNA